MTQNYSVRRIKHTIQAVAQVLRNVYQDVRIFLRLRHDEIVLRNRRIGDTNILVRADEDPGRDIYLFGKYEENESDFVLSRIRESDVCFDVGANVGYYTLMLAQRAKRGSVHAFEPVPLNFHILNTNVLANKLRNVIVNNCAVGDGEGTTEFVVATDAAYSSMVDTRRKSIAERIVVPVVTLDSYCASHGIERIDFIKADVEGAEGQVVRGAAGLLADKDRRPRLIMLELHEPMLQRYRSSVDNIVRTLQSYDYKAVVSDRGGIVTFEPERSGAVYNVCFLSNAYRSELLREAY